MLALDGQDRRARCRPRRGDHRFDERGHDRPGRVLVDRPVEADDAAERRQRVGLARADVGLGNRGARRRAARVGVLDDHRRRLAELQHDARRGVEVEQVGERQLLALEHRPARRGPSPAIERVPRRGLVRVLAVAQVAQLVARRRRGDRAPAAPPPASRGTRRRATVTSAERRGNRRVVSCRCARRRGARARSGTPRSGRRSRSSSASTAGVIARGHHDEHIAEILGSRAHQARPADVDLLDRDRRNECRAAPRSPRTGYRLTTTRSTRPMPCCSAALEVLGMMAAGQDAAVDLRVQRLDAAVHHLGKPGDVRNVDYRQAGIGQRLGGPAGRDQLESAATQTAAERQRRPDLSDTLRMALFMGDVSGIDTKCNRRVEFPRGPSYRTRKAAQCGLFCARTGAIRPRSG